FFATAGGGNQQTGRVEVRAAAPDDWLVIRGTDRRQFVPCAVQPAIHRWTMGLDRNRFSASQLIIGQFEQDVTMPNRHLSINLNVVIAGMFGGYISCLV